MIARLVRWYDGHPVAGDACLAALILVGFAPPSDLGAEHDPLVDVTMVVSALRERTRLLALSATSRRRSGPRSSAPGSHASCMT